MQLNVIHCNSPFRASNRCATVPTCKIWPFSAALKCKSTQRKDKRRVCEFGALLQDFSCSPSRYCCLYSSRKREKVTLVNHTPWSSPCDCVARRTAERQSGLSCSSRNLSAAPASARTAAGTLCWRAAAWRDVDQNQTTPLNRWLRTQRLHSSEIKSNQIKFNLNKWAAYAINNDNIKQQYKTHITKVENGY